MSRVALQFCAVCSAPLNKALKQLRYCSVKCRTKYHNAQTTASGYSREWQRAKNDKLAQASANKIKCAICGRYYRRPTHHAWQRHGVNEREYKEAAELDHKKGVVLPEDSERMRQHAFENGMSITLPVLGARTRFKKNHKINYERSQQTKERLTNHGKWLAATYSPPKKKKL